MKRFMYNTKYYFTKCNGKWDFVGWVKFMRVVM